MVFKFYLITVIVLIVFVVLNLCLPLEKANILFDSFNKVVIGFAALITAYFGSSYFFEEVLRKRRIDNYRKSFLMINMEIHGKLLLERIGMVSLMSLIKKHQKYIIYGI